MIVAVVLHDIWESDKVVALSHLLMVMVAALTQRAVMVTLTGPVVKVVENI